MKQLFYYLRDKPSLKLLAEWDHDKMNDALEGVCCDIDPGHQREGGRLHDLFVVLPDGLNDDFVFTWQSECLVNEGTLTIFRDSGLTGFEVKPVYSVFRKSLKPTQKLWELSVTGWGGMAKPESGIRFNNERSCKVCGHLRYTGLDNPVDLIDESQWDGSDFFIVWPMPRFLLITERVVRVLQDNKLTGYNLIPVPDLEETDGFTPGRLHYYMPHDRAHVLGDPFGIY